MSKTFHSYCYSIWLHFDIKVTLSLKGVNYYNILFAGMSKIYFTYSLIRFTIFSLKVNIHRQKISWYCCWKSILPSNTCNILQVTMTLHIAHSVRWQWHTVSLHWPHKMVYDSTPFSVSIAVLWTSWQSSQFAIGKTYMNTNMRWGYQSNTSTIIQ